MKKIYIFLGRLYKNKKFRRCAKILLGDASTSPLLDETARFL